MAKKEQETFTVTDRRLFTSEGDVREDSSEDSREEKAAATAVVSSPAAVEATPQEAMPPAPTAAEQQQQADAYRASSRDMDRRVEQGGHSTKDLEVTFERFLASLYMTAMMQLGMMHEEGGQPRLDPISARQTIDTISLLADKTKGNLASAEQTFLQNCLYELRMAYVEVINALSRAPQNPASVAGSKPGGIKPGFGK
jgi:Domain of unknown function (DUF1844)